MTSSDLSSPEVYSQRPAENVGTTLIYILWSAFVLLYLLYESRDEYAKKEQDHKLICQALNALGNFKQPWKLYDTVYAVHSAGSLFRYILIPALVAKCDHRDNRNFSFGYSRLESVKGQIEDAIRLHDHSHLFTFLFLMLFASFRASYSQIDLIDDPRCVDKNITLCHTGVATKCDQWLSEQVQQLDYGNDYKLAMCSLGLQVVILLYNVGKFIVSRCDDESCIRRIRLSC